MVRVAFFHPDLGIGGAENLVVNSAVCLLKKFKHDVVIFTAHHDSSHCFKPTIDGTLRVKVFGDFLPIGSTAGRLLFCFLRMLWVFVRVFIIVVLDGRRFDVAVNDQLALINPLLKLVAKRVVFYGHFPDMLLCTDRKTHLKKAYRFAFDSLEKITTKTADVILVNSKFTAEVFSQNFEIPLSRLVVLYPPVDVETIKIHKQCDLRQDLRESITNDYFLSLNRYERKKNVELCIKAYASLFSAVENRPALVIAGGYDDRIPENVEYFGELRQLAADLGVDPVFLKSVNDDLRLSLLSGALALCYTPSNEHFGIVPVEAMACGTPVIALNSGGPRETVENGKTGYLVGEDTGCFAEAMGSVWRTPDQFDKAYMRDRVSDLFGLEGFAERLNSVIVDDRFKHE